MSIAGLVTLVGTFLPWLHSGSTTRSSYALLGVLARLDLTTDGVVSTLVRWWPLVPLLVTAAVVAAWWRWTWLSVGVAATAAIYAGGVGAVIVVAARGTGIDLGVGPWVCGVGALVLLVSSTWSAISTTRRAARAPASALPADRS